MFGGQVCWVEWGEDNRKYSKTESDHCAHAWEFSSNPQLFNADGHDREQCGACGDRCHRGAFHSIRAQVRKVSEDDAQ